jgi:pyridoxal 5'-phosphate synthase pdxT subunit
VAGKIKIGVLALQGAVDPHVRHLNKLGAESVLVRKPEQLVGLSGIVLPGGESTSMIHLLKLNSLWNPLKAFSASKPVFGVCAGAILLAKHVTHPHQESLGVLDVHISRNAFGRQVDSFASALELTTDWPGSNVEGVFIRAPRFTQLGAEVKTFFRFQGESVMVSQGKILAATFHPELTDSLEIHHYFVTQCQGEDLQWMTDSPNTCDSLSVN